MGNFCYIFSAYWELITQILFIRARAKYEVSTTFRLRSIKLVCIRFEKYYGIQMPENNISSNSTNYLKLNSKKIFFRKNVRNTKISLWKSFITLFRNRNHIPSTTKKGYLWECPCSKIGPRIINRKISNFPVDRDRIRISAT